MDYEVSGRSLFEKISNFLNELRKKKSVAVTEESISIAGLGPRIKNKILRRARMLTTPPRKYENFNFNTAHMHL
jgi:hypothetical protein